MAWVPGSRSKVGNCTSVPSLYSWNIAECDVNPQSTTTTDRHLTKWSLEATRLIKHKPQKIKKTILYHERFASQKLLVFENVSDLKSADTVLRYPNSEKHCTNTKQTGWHLVGWIIMTGLGFSPSPNKARSLIMHSFSPARYAPQLCEH